MPKSDEMPKTLADYRYDHTKLGVTEYEVAAGLLLDAARARRRTVEIRDVGADNAAVGSVALHALIQEQIGRALQEGRLVILDSAPTSPGYVPGEEEK